MRSGQYARMNATVVTAEAYGGMDDIGEPIITWQKIDPEKEAVGYAFAFRLTNGFSKVAYWSKDKVEAHARRFSQAYRKGWDCPWISDFDEMALKTVVKNTLSKWGPLSVEMRDAIMSDQADADGNFVDNPKEDAPPADTGMDGLRDVLDVNGQDVTDPDNNLDMGDTPPEPEQEPPAEKPKRRRISEVALSNAAGQLGAPDHLILSWLVSLGKLQEDQGYGDMEPVDKVWFVDETDANKQALHQWIDAQ